MTTVYSAARIQETYRLVALVEDGEVGHYGLVDSWLYHAFLRHPIYSQDVLVVGSCEQGFGPWYEMMAWCEGSNRITITDYNPVTYGGWEQVFHYLPPASVPTGRFDAILSISSFEHSGLGRYGDTINEDGDLESMTWAKYALRPGGKMFLAVPLGRDKVVGNLHRYYGPERLPKLLKGWKVIDTEGFQLQRLWADADWDSGRKEGFPEYAPILVCAPELK